MTKWLYPRLAARNIRRDRQFYLPYLLTVIGTGAAFYVVSALAAAPDLPDKQRYTYLSVFMTIGSLVIVLFAVIFLTYTASFLSKRRRRELGLYNVLGMGKGHIGLVLAFESLYLGVLGIGGGIAAGAILQLGATWLLGKLMRLDIGFGLYFSPSAALSTALLLGTVLLLDLVLDLCRVWRQKPVELLRSVNTGEREPKTRWLSAALGVVTLGSGYAIALLTRSAIQALALYFIAVILVVIGTYCLFAAVSIVILKALRRNKGFYYRTHRFISLSGMLYRMKRNGVGLANICILCTMVLVMVSGTLTLYLGTQAQLPRRFPGEVTLSVRYDLTDPQPLDEAALDARFAQFMTEAGYAPTLRGSGAYAVAALTRESDGVFREYAQPQPDKTQVYFHLMSYESYEAQTGLTLPRDGKVHLAVAGGYAPATLTLDLGGDAPLVYPVGTPLDRVPDLVSALVYVADQDYCAVLPREALTALSQARRDSQGHALTFTRECWWDLGGDPAQHGRQLDALHSRDWTGLGQFFSLSFQSRFDFAADYYSLNGGFFFLGVFLGLLFLMATVLIIYYKQLSEGYEDAGRYHIMRSVGLEDVHIRRSVNSQLRVVFFAPLLVSAVHVAFDFPLVQMLLTLFGLRDGPLTLLCTLGVFGGFTLLYVGVYRLTARACCRLAG